MTAAMLQCSCVKYLMFMFKVNVSTHLFCWRQSILFLFFWQINEIIHTEIDRIENRKRFKVIWYSFDCEARCLPNKYNTRKNTMTTSMNTGKLLQKHKYNNKPKPYHKQHYKHSNLKWRQFFFNEKLFFTFADMLYFQMIWRVKFRNRIWWPKLNGEIWACNRVRAGFITCFTIPNHTFYSFADRCHSKRRMHQRMPRRQHHLPRRCNWQCNTPQPIHFW